VQTVKKMTRGIVPLVRLSCKRSINLAKAINPPLIVIPIYDLICNISTEPNKLFYEIESCGGIHNFLDYPGVVILSLIMRDDLILKFSPEKYAQIIRGFKPDTYTTVDGGTYKNEDKKSFKELIRLSNETKELMRLCPEIKPIGHVKGCNSSQVKLHLEYLENLGITTFIFHVGDFSRNGDDSLIQQAKHFCSLIKNDRNTLLVYGVGSPRKMLDFSFADVFITYSHFVNARYGKIFRGTKKVKFNGLSVYEAALHNFNEFLKYLKGLRYQTKLFQGGECKWVEALPEQQSIIQNPKIRN